jgi:hypothetical protein
MGTELEQWESLLAATTELDDETSGPGSRSDVDVCRIYDAATETNAHHNCIGCNLRGLVSEVRRVVEAVTELRRQGQPLEPQTEIRIVFGLLNTYWESLLNCFEIVRLHDEYTKSPAHFPTFQQIRRWTNFFKHPGPFGYKIHHPQFGYASSPNWIAEIVKTTDPETGKLEDRYVKEFFGADAKQKIPKHLEHLRDYKTALVTLPNLQDIATGLLVETKRALDVLTVELYAGVLATNSTIEEFYCSPVAEHQSGSASAVNATKGSSDHAALVVLPIP